MKRQNKRIIKKQLEEKRLKRTWRRIRVEHFFGRLFGLLVILIIALCLLLHRMFIGPSVSVRNTLTMSLLESSALKFIPYIYLGEEKVNEIIAISTPLEPDYKTDVSLVNIQQNGEEVHSDDSTPEIELINVKGNTYKGYLLIVKDPSRVFVGVSDEYFATPGKRLDKYVEEYNAVGGINANGFSDAGGMGDGGTPIGLVVSNCKIAD